MANTAPVHLENYPIHYMEVTFECVGLLPNTNASSGTNVAVGNLGEIRLGNGVIRYHGYEAYFQGHHIGTVDGAPSCSVMDAGEPAYPSWNKINLDPGLAMTLSAQDPDHGTLSLVLKNGMTVSASW